MASTKFDLAQGTWTQITTDDKNGDIFHNNGNTQIIYVEAETAPLTWDGDTPTMAVTIKGQSLPYDGVGDSSFVFAYAISSDAVISVTPSVDFIEAMVTDKGLDSARFKVDSQQTSFENNSQFHLFYRMQEIPSGSQMVIKLDIVNPINIMKREIDVWTGGREYLIYREDGTHIAPAVFDDTLDNYPVNENVQGGGAHPVSAVIAQIAIGSGIFDENGGTPAFNGSASVTDSGANKATSQSSESAGLAGYAAGTTLYLVFDHIGANNDTSGHYYLQWEERF